MKDNIDIEGVETTAACPAFAHRAARSATAVQRLEAAGAVWIAKTNLDQFATGLVGTRRPTAALPAPFAPERISGGPAQVRRLAVAATCLALGTDTAGSGACPRASNQLVGLEADAGSFFSTAGVVPACRSLDCVSVFGTRVDDAPPCSLAVKAPIRPTSTAASRRAR